MAIRVPELASALAASRGMELPVPVRYVAPMRRLFSSLGLAVVTLASITAHGAEGKWTPQQMLRLDPKMLQKEGLKLPPTRLWDEKRGTGLLAGTVNISGCSGAFVSPEGLIVTNHHCVFPIVQEHTTKDADLISNGFLAKTRAQELPSKSTRIRIPRSFTDVTAAIQAAVPAGATDLQRFAAVDQKQKALQAECEKKPGARCAVVAENGGLVFTLVEEVELQDVRLVYAPPRAVGEYGGEVDNWMWPRHTGDFGIVRAYVAKDGAAAPPSTDNVPYRPEFFFPLSAQGVSPGDFVMVLGYPGRTFRELLAAEVQERRDRFFPRIEALSGRFIDVLEAVQDKDGSIAVASQLKSLHNRKKNAGGQLAGFVRGQHVEHAQNQEAAVVAFAERAGRRTALDARAELLREHAQRQSTWDRELLLNTLSSGSRALWLAVQVARLSLEREKPDLERDPGYMDRELPRLRDRLEREQKNIFLPADAELLSIFVEEAFKVPAETSVKAVQTAFARKDGKQSTTKEIRAFVDRMLKATRVTTLDARMAMLGKPPTELRLRGDKLLDLGFLLAEEQMALKLEEDRRMGVSFRLRPLWRAAVIAQAGRPVAPDANGTLRFSFAHVQGYTPRDGLLYLPQTTLGGAVAKHTGLEPFDFPARISAARGRAASSRFVDPKLKDVPVAFLADADTTGGNSGSPVVDGEGRLVGINFDRVWENVANDFRYDPAVARNVSVDIRFMLFSLEEVEGASALVREMGAGP